MGRESPATARALRRIRSCGVSNGAGHHPTNAGDGVHRGGKSRDVVEQRERCEVIGAAGIVAPALTGADQNAVARGKTELADLPNSDETSTYTKSGSSLRRNETQTVGTMSMVSSADLSVSGSSLTGTVETKATSEDGELQSQARTTFQLSKQTAAE